MSVARGFGLNGKSIYTNVVKPTEVWCNFVVDSTNGNGLGIRSLKSNGYIEHVYMYTNPAAAATVTSVFLTTVTSIVVSSVAGIAVGQAVADSTTSGNIQAGTTVVSINAATNTVVLSLATGGGSAASPGDTLTFTATTASTRNPIPLAGYAEIIFKNNFNYYLGGFSGQVITPSAPTTASTTAGHVYVITVVGTATLAQWQAAGLPAGLTPTVGQAFIALATGTIGTGAKVGLAGIPTTHVVTVIGDPNQSISNSNIAANAGARIIVQFAAPTDSTHTALVAAAPADNTVIGMQFCFDASSVTIPDAPLSGGTTSGI